MSSHHFVRAQQSACLIVLNNNIDWEVFSQLLEWNPIIIATDLTYNWLLSHEIKIDFLISDNKNLNYPYPIETIDKKEIVSIIEDIDARTQAEEIIIIGDLDKLKILDFVLKETNTKISIIEHRNKYILIPKNTVFKKWMNLGETWNYYPNKSFQITGSVDLFENGFKTLCNERIMIRTYENIILIESI